MITRLEVRVNDILLGPLERPALRWLAAHTPAWVTPNMMTALGLLGALVTAFGYALTHFGPGFLWLANAGLVLNWLGDSLDGTLARFRHAERPRYGYFIDHTVDAFSLLAISLGLGASPYVRFDLAALALIGYLLMASMTYIRVHVDRRFQIAYGKIGPTEMRAAAVLVNTGIYFAGNPVLRLPLVQVTVFDLLVALVAAAEIVTFCVLSLILAARYSDLDR
jgi:phosphatidylglycerophosphate synthase